MSGLFYFLRIRKLMNSDRGYEWIAVFYCPLAEV